MPQFAYQQRCEGYVNPAQLCSPLPVVYEQDMGSPEQFDNLSIDIGSPSMQLYDNMSGWPSSPSESSKRNPWSRHSSMDDSSSTSPPSTAPSPGSTQQGQNGKRRAQNRAAQRAYRDRKMRYLLDLESGIKEIEQKIRNLQSENTDLIRELCEMRAANNDLRGSSNSKAPSKSLPNPLLTNSTTQQPSQPLTQTLQAARSSIDVAASTGELDALYEPFAAMWNLIHLDPSVVKGVVSPQTVLEKLKSMVECGGMKADIKAPPRSYSTSNVPGWPAVNRQQKVGAA